MSFSNKKEWYLRTPRGAGREKQMTNIETSRLLVAVSRPLCATE